MNHEQAYRILGHTPQAPDGHWPNQPRQRDGEGNKVDEPVQCVRCQQAWPCESYRLSSR